MSSAVRKSLPSLLTLVALVALVVPARAGGQAGCNDPVKCRGGATTEAQATPTTAARRDEASVGPASDDYLPLSRTASPATASRTPEAAAALAKAPKSGTPGPAQAHAKASSKKPARPHASAPAPAKVSLPNRPARPGMGTLIRFGITMSPEIS